MNPIAIRPASIDEVRQWLKTGEANERSASSEAQCFFAAIARHYEGACHHVTVSFDAEYDDQQSYYLRATSFVPRDVEGKALERVMTLDGGHAYDSDQDLYLGWLNGGHCDPYEKADELILYATVPPLPALYIQA